MPCRQRWIIPLLVALLTLPLTIAPALAGTNILFLPHVRGGTEQPTPPPPPADWLGRLNAYRAMAGLPAVTENSGWSHGAMLHARYMVKTNTISHNESPGSPWYTVEGQQAAQNGNVFVSSSTATSDGDAIDFWMEGPFHAIGILDPQLAQSGFGSYREADGGWQMGATVDVSRGRGAIPPTLQFPVAWPGEGSVVRLVAHSGNEFPDPLASCPGYSAPSGLPILLQVGDGSGEPVVTDHSISDGGTALAHCLFDEGSYQHPDGWTRDLGRLILDSRDAIVLIPRDPLQPGHEYTVSITVNGQPVQWRFTVAADALAAEE